MDRIQCINGNWKINIRNKKHIPCTAWRSACGSENMSSENNKAITNNILQTTTKQFWYHFIYKE
jgi:hypothetical protein